jgi:two-component system CheB/CheR fusion protein
MNSSSTDPLEKECSENQTDWDFLGGKNFRHLAEALPAIIFTATPEGEVDFFSEQWGQFVGISPDEPEYLNWGPRLHPEDLDEVARSWAEAVEAGHVYESEFRLRSAEGNYLWFHTRVIPVRDSQLRIVKWCGVTTDVDERKKLNIELRAVSERKDQFVAMLGHELRNPLAAIRTSYDVMGRNEAEEKQKEEAYEILGRQIDHLTRLVDDTLDVARLSSDKLRLIRCPMELNQLVDDCCAGYREHAKAKAISLQKKTLDTEAWVDGDHDRLVQCLNNLIDNALKFTNPNGTVSVELEALSDMVLLRVVDSGIGMQPEELEQVFQPFEQGDGATDLTTKGLGLGLSIVEKLVELHGGRISVTSPGPHQGTKFEIRLPAIDAMSETVQENQAEGLQDELEILVLEDNESVAQSLKMFLELENHKVRLAEDGATALTLLEEKVPDVLLSDLTLPGGMSGWDVAKKVNGSYPLPRRPYLVALSGHAQQHYRDQSLEAGFDEHLAKPPTPDQLRKTLVNGIAELVKRRSQ